MNKSNFGFLLVVLIVSFLSCKKTDDVARLTVQTPCQTHVIHDTINGTLFKNCSLQPYVNKKVSMMVERGIPYNDYVFTGHYTFTDTQGNFILPYSYERCFNDNTNGRGLAVTDGAQYIFSSIPDSITPLSHFERFPDSTHFQLRIQTTTGLTSTDTLYYWLDGPVGLTAQSLIGPFSNNQLIGNYVLQNGVYELSWSLNIPNYSNNPTLQTLVIPNSSCLTVDTAFILLD